MKIKLLTAVLCSISAQTYANDHQVDDLKKELALLQLKVQQLEFKANENKTEVKAVKAQSPSSVTFKPYGFIRFDMAHHFQGADKIFNSINTVPLDDQKNVNSKTFYNVNASRLGLDVQGKVNDQDVLAKIEVDFRGGSSNDQLRIRHAYIKVDNWLFGQTTSPFVSADILPEKLDFMANLGGAIQRNPQIQYQHTIDQNTKTWIALEDGSNSRNIDDQTRLPTLTGKIQIRSDDQKSVLSARALVGQKKTSSDEEIAWGLGLGGIYQIDEKNKLHADYYHVKGDSKYVLFANDAYVLDEQDNNEIVANEFDSIALGLTHQWNSQWRSTLGLGAMLAHDNDYAELSPSANESLYQGWVNLMYNPSRPLTYGLEYVHGERTTFSDKKGTDSRLEAMVRYAF